MVSVTSIALGVGTLYLLTIRQNEEGKIEDYLKRIWKRIYKLRQSALSKHLAFINVIAGALTSLLDRVFGSRLFSLRSIGVSLCLAVASTNTYFFGGRIRRSDFHLDHLFDGLTAIVLIFIPYFLSKHFGTSCNEGGDQKPFRPLQCRYLRASPGISFQSVSANLARDYKFACLCASTWIVVWFLVVLTVIYNQYFSLFFCAYCFPAPLRPFILIIGLVISSMFAVAAGLFTLFLTGTRLSLKQLATTKSTFKAIGFLLLGCLAIPVFAIFLKVILFFFHRIDSASPGLTTKGWILIGFLAVFVMAFFINAIFVVSSVFFFLIAALLLAHRIIWPMVERPIERLHRIGIIKHPWAILLTGIFLIAFGVGGLEASLKVLKFLRGS
jgi:hypothetical protein